MLNPLQDRVLIEPAEAEGITRGGIHLPDPAKEKPTKGTVLAVGPGRILDSGERGTMSVKSGDMVLYERYAGSEVEVDGKKLIVVRESDVVAILS